MLPSLIKESQDAEMALRYWTSALTVHEKNTTRVYPSLEEALTEVLVGLMKLFPHKKRVLLMEGGQALLKDANQYLTGEALEVETCSFESWPSKKEELLKQDFLLAIVPEDHCLTGEIYPYKEFYQEWNKARKFSIGISSRSHFYDSETLSEKEGFRARLLQFGPNSAIAVLGSRMRKLAKLVLGNRSFSEKQFTELESWKQYVAEESKGHFDLGPDFELLSFENICPDRRTYRIENVDAYALKQAAVEEWGELFEPHILTGSLCEWGGIRPLDWAHIEKSAEILVLSVEILNKKEEEFAPLLQKIKKMMG